MEYLLYEPGHGYRWLVHDEGSFLLGVPLAGGDVDLRGAPHVVRYANTKFKLRNTGVAIVNYVIGEFYWKVTVGETVDVADYEYEGNVVSSEKGKGETNWTFAKPLDTQVVRSAFGLGFEPTGPPNTPKAATIRKTEKRNSPIGETNRARSPRT